MCIKFKSLRSIQVHHLAAAHDNNKKMRRLGRADNCAKWSGRASRKISFVLSFVLGAHQQGWSLSFVRCVVFHSRLHSKPSAAQQQQPHALTPPSRRRITIKSNACRTHCARRIRVLRLISPIGAMLWATLGEAMCGGLFFCVCLTYTHLSLRTFLRNHIFVCRILI